MSSTIRQRLGRWWTAVSWTSVGSSSGQDYAKDHYLLFGQSGYLVPEEGGCFLVILILQGSAGVLVFLRLQELSELSITTSFHLLESVSLHLPIVIEYRMLRYTPGRPRYAVGHTYPLRVEHATLKTHVFILDFLKNFPGSGLAMMQVGSILMLWSGGVR